MSTVLAIDQGTTSTKAVVISEAGDVVASAAVCVGRSYPRAGWVEQDPEELWQSVMSSISQLPHLAPSCLALSSQRESVLMWDRATGAPLTPCVSWQCNRGAELCAQLRASGAESLIRELTGLPLDPMFSASKLRHLLDGDPALRAAAAAGTACAGTVDSWLLFKLSGGTQHVSDAGNASRTLLFDIHDLEWSERLLELFAVPRACLPEVGPSCGDIAESIALGSLPRLPITASLGDSHAAAFGLGCREPGRAKATYGTGTSLLAPTADTPLSSSHGLATTIAWLGEELTYAVEGNVFSSGATVDWLAGVLGLPDPAAVERLAATVPSSAGVHLVPAFVGLGAPYWERQARGSIDGLTFSTGAAELARAAVESIAFQVADLVDALERDMGRPLVELRVDGGASRNDALMQFQADLLGCPVLRSRQPNAAAFGAALMGRVAPKARSAEEPRDGAWERFDPALPAPEREALLAGWHSAVAAGVHRREAMLA